MESDSYNAIELMICVASRVLEDGATVAVGTGAPCAAAMLAQKTVSPNLLIVFEAGGLGPQLPTMPISVGDSRTFHRAMMAASMMDIMEACQRGMVDYTFLGGAQIDQYGNLNSTVLGDYLKPKVRFPGSGGANDFASFCWRTLVMTPHIKRRFVHSLDFLTTPGFLDGRNEREISGLPAGTGPYKVITDLAVLGFSSSTGKMQVESLHPSVTQKDVRENTDFELGNAENVGLTDPPTVEELRILRTEVDPQKFIIGR